MKRFLTNLGVQVHFQVTQGDTICTFDNNQILQRSLNVNVDSKFRCHIVTMVVGLEGNSADNYQYRPEFKPVNWVFKEADEVKNVRLLAKSRDIKKKHYDAHLDPYLVDNITNVVQEQNEISYDESTKKSHFRDFVGDY